MTNKPETTSAEGDASRATLWGLVCLDDEIRKTAGGVPGSGIYGLLDMLAGQFLGVQRGAYPAEPPPVDPPATQAAGPEPDPAAVDREELKYDPPKASAKVDPPKPHAGGNHRR